MSKPITRLGDLSAGHGFPPTPSISASSDVFVNGIGVVRVGDAYATHCIKDSCHAGNLAGGSGTVNVNGKPVGRVGDGLSCGDSVGMGSPDVFVGG